MASKLCSLNFGTNDRLNIVYLGYCKCVFHKIIHISVAQGLCKIVVNEKSNDNDNMINRSD